MSLKGMAREHGMMFLSSERSWDTKCYVTCSADEVGDYLKRVDKQTHACYKGIDLTRFRCECDLSLVLATSHSVNNPGRLYLKCPDLSIASSNVISEPRGLWKRPPNGISRNTDIAEALNTLTISRVTPQSDSHIIWDSSRPIRSHPCYHVVGVTLGDRGYPPPSLTERELDPNRERLGSNLHVGIKETQQTTLSTFIYDWDCLVETDGEETTR